MNYRVVFSTLGKILVFAGLIVLIPFFVGVFSGEENVYASFLTPIATFLAVGFPMSKIKVKDNTMFAKEGFVIVALSWILLGLIGALPFVISGAIPNYIDALFETVSGLTTTGASILTSEQIELMYVSQKGLMFWRLFTHWLGGMGVLVFVLALFPSMKEGAIHIYRAEAPGPDSSKLVSKIGRTARILYGIYIAMTLLEAILLLFSGIPVYDCILNAFSTAGTGGFAIRGDGIPFYNSAYIEMVIATFMFLFGINFNIYYFILIGSFSKAFRNEEFRVYVVLIFTATLVIAINILKIYENFFEALRYSFFQVTAIGSTTGLSSADFDTWPTLSKSILMLLTLFGGCAGSTAGGMKISRAMILCKSGAGDVKKLIHPRGVYTLKLDGDPVGKDVERNVRCYFIMWVIITVLGTVLLSIDSYCGGNLLTSFSATLACIGNVGPGFAGVGPMQNYLGFSPYSKVLLSLIMLAGRLEIFPMIFLFSPRTWKRG